MCKRASWFCLRIYKTMLRAETSLRFTDCQAGRGAVWSGPVHKQWDRLAWTSPVKINRKGLNKFSPWHSESIEFLTPYSAFVCFTWRFVHWEDTRAPLLHTLSAEWESLSNLEDIEIPGHSLLMTKTVPEEHVWSIYHHQDQRDAGQSEPTDLYFLLQLQLRKLFIALVELN